LDSLRVNDSVILKDLHIDFDRGKLVHIGCGDPKGELFRFLKERYGVTYYRMDKKTMKLEIASFETNTDSTRCLFGSECEGQATIIITKHNWRHY